MKRKGIDVDEPPPKRRKTRENDEPKFDLQDPLVRLCLELVKADESELEDIFQKIRKIKQQRSETVKKPSVNLSLREKSDSKQSTAAFSTKYFQFLTLN